jgi:hypothetical protein
MAGWVFNTYKDAHAGYTSGAILSVLTAQSQTSPCSKNNLAILWSGTNDGLQADCGGTQANIRATYTTLQAAGYKTIVVTLMPWSGFSASCFASINAGILGAPFPNVLEISMDPILLSGLSVINGTWKGTYDDIYRCASGPARGHLTAAGEAYVASLLAPILISLKR